jgi:hypothetical protein
MTDQSRKLAEIWGFAAFKTVVRFCFIFAAFKPGGPYTSVCIILLLAIDLATQGVLIALEALVTDLKEKVWVDMLTDRIFYRNFIDEIRLGNRPDVDHMFSLATKDAVADVLKAREDGGQNLQRGWLGKLSWGAWALISNAFSYALGYGIPMVLASQ